VKSGVTINVQIGGKQTGKFAFNNPRLTEAISKAISQRIIYDAATIFTGKQLDDIARLLQKRGRKEIERLMPFIANNLMGIVTPQAVLDTKSIDIRARDPNPATVSDGFRPVVQWRSLSYTWRRKKKQNNNLFFIHTGALQDLFLRFGMRTWTKLGDVEITVNRTPVEVLRKGPKYGGSFKLASIDVVVGREMNANSFGGGLFEPAPTMNLARKLGFSSTSISKLVGNTARPDYHRPLLAPAVAYWYFFKVPGILNNRLRRALNMASNQAQLSVVNRQDGS
jgi:hypothetical protein